MEVMSHCEMHECRILANFKFVSRFFFRLSFRTEKRVITKEKEKCEQQIAYTLQSKNNNF